MTIFCKIRVRDAPVIIPCVDGREYHRGCRPHEIAPACAILSQALRRPPGFFPAHERRGKTCRWPADATECSEPTDRAGLEPCPSYAPCFPRRQEPHDPARGPPLVPAAAADLPAIGRPRCDEPPLPPSTAVFLMLGRSPRPSASRPLISAPDFFRTQIRTFETGRTALPC